MIKIGLYCEPINERVSGYWGLYRECFIVDYMKRNRTLYGLIHNFFEISVDGQSLKYTEQNEKMMVTLYQNLKREKWSGDLICFTDEKQIKMPGFPKKGYDICSDSMYYSPIGDGFLIRYDSRLDFYRDMSFETYSMYRANINENGLFNSIEIALSFSEYCNYINKKHLYCIESQDNWRPVTIWEHKTARGRPIRGRFSD